MERPNIIIDNEPNRLYYVTIRDANRVGYLLGPYESHVDALNAVDHGRSLAERANAFACFHAFGTASIPRDAKQPRTVFPL